MGKTLSREEQYKAEIIKVIAENKIVFFDHCFAFTTFSRATAYNHELDKIDEIREAIGKNRVKAKNYLINKWIASNNPTLQISAYRLMSSSEEHVKLNQSYVDVTSAGEKIKEMPKWFSEATDEQE